MSNMKFRMAAKTDMGLVRTNNEDNFQAAADLTAPRMSWVNNEIYSLGDMGALLVVADGMGGMNAGEVASALAIETICDYFSARRLTPDIIRNRFSIEKYMNAAITAADARIKQEAHLHPETRGMGTTIVIGWVLNGKLYVSWCGDSRAYIYNPSAGLHQITKDHSYVQSLVDKGALSREEAFDFPDSNIITQSLSDAVSKAKPESLMRPYNLNNGDIILLCTDGLCGMLHDQEMEAVIRANEHDMDLLTDELIHAACEAEGSDNITVTVLQVLQGGGVCDPAIFEESERWLSGGRNRNISGSGDHGEDSNEGGDDGNARKWKRLAIILAAVIVVIVCLALIFFIQRCGSDEEQPVTVTEEQTESQESPESADTKPNEEPSSTDTNMQAGQKKSSEKRKNPESGSIFSPTETDSTGIPVEGNDSTKTERLNEIEGATDDVGEGSNSEEDIEEGDPPLKEGEKTSKPEGTPTGGGDIPDGWMLITITKGQTLYGISKEYGIPVDELVNINNLKNADDIKEGKTLLVPKKN